MSKLCTQNVRFRCTMDCPDSSDASADDHRKQKIITNDENSEFTGIYTIKKMQKNFGSSSTLGCEKSTPRCHVTWSTFFFSKTTRASSNAKVKSSLTFWCICNFQHFYRSNLRPPINLKIFEIWNFTPPINFYLKVNYLILGWDLKKRVGSAVLLP